VEGAVGSSQSICGVLKVSFWHMGCVIGQKLMITLDN
jgi:hypothetical protein